MSNCHTCMRQALLLEGQALALKQEREDMHHWREKAEANKRIAAMREDADGWRREAARCKGKH